MGAHACGIHVRGESQDSVVAALSRLVREAALVSRPAKGWVSVYDSSSEMALAEASRVAAGLSQALGRVTIHLHLFDGDIVNYVLFDNGRPMDAFDSNPGYFGSTSKTEMRATKGNPSLLTKYCVQGVSPQRLSLLFSRGRARQPAGEEERLRELALALGIAPTRAETRYSDVIVRGTPKCVRVVSAEGLREASLRKAAARGDLPRIRSLLSKGVTGPARDARGRTAIDAAVERGQRAALAPLLERGADQQALNSGLWGAAARSDLAAVRLLLKHGADANSVDERGATPLYRAVFNPKANRRVVQEILGAGARVNERLDVEFMARRDRGRAALHYAASVAPLDVVAQLVDRGAKLDVQDAKGTTPLMIAANLGRADIVEYLMEQGARTSTRDSLGLTALDLARLATKSPASKVRAGARVIMRVLSPRDSGTSKTSRRRANRRRS